MKQRLTVLGSTGSIGTNTLDVVARHPDPLRSLCPERGHAGGSDAGAMRAILPALRRDGQRPACRLLAEG